MSFATLNAKRDRQLQLADSDLARARQRQLMLASLPSARAVVDALRSARGAEVVVAAALTAALLTEVQAGLGGLQAVLLYAYLPMLGALRRRLLGRFPRSEEDLEERLVAAFYVAVANWPGRVAEPKPCLYLLRTTYQQVRAELRQALRESENIALVEQECLDAAEEAAWADRPRTVRQAIRFREGLEQDSGELAVILRDQVAGRVTARKLALVEATVLCGQELRTHVEEKYPRQSSAVRERTYKRLQRERARTLGALRALLSDWRDEVLASEAA